MATNDNTSSNSEPNLLEQANAIRTCLRMIPIIGALISSPSKSYDFEPQELALFSFRALLTTTVAFVSPEQITSKIVQNASEYEKLYDDAIHAHPEENHSTNCILLLASSIMSGYPPDSLSEIFHNIDHLSSNKAYSKAVAFDTKLYLGESFYFDDRMQNKTPLFSDLTSYLTIPLWVSPEDQSIFPENIHDNTFLFFDTSIPMSEDWGFWRDWYKGFYEGKPLDWNLQREVALIPDADWGKGPAHIADKIDEIKARFLIDKTALSEKIGFNPETQKFYATPVPIVNPRLLSTNLTLISDALDEAMRGNGLRPDCWEDRTLRKTVERFANNPERIEMDCMRVHRRLATKLGNELPESDELVDLSATLLDVALDIRANHPNVADNRAKRGAQALRESSADEKALLKEAIPHIRAITDKDLGPQLADDFDEIIEGEALSGAAPIDPVIRTGNRVAQMWLLAHKLDKRMAKEISDAAEASKEFIQIAAAITLFYSIWPFLLNILGF